MAWLSRWMVGLRRIDPDPEIDDECVAPSALICDLIIYPDFAVGLPTLRSDSRTQLTLRPSYQGLNLTTSYARHNPFRHAPSGSKQ
jgi:hypothetical protein